MTNNIKNFENKQNILEETINNFLDSYPWFERRLNNMSDDHRTAIGVLMEQTPGILFHLKVILDRNLDEDKFEMKVPNTWGLTHEEYVLSGLLSLMADNDEVIIYGYKKGSGIIGLDGKEFDATN